MYYLQSRYYDPAIGRFINADTFATTDAEGFLSCNMFAYCENNPVNRNDPTGDITFSAILTGAAIGAAWGAINGGIAAALSGENFITGALEGAAIGAVQGAITTMTATAVIGVKIVGAMVSGIAAAGIETATQRITKAPTNSKKAIAIGVSTAIFTGLGYWTKFVKSKMNFVEKSVIAKTENSLNTTIGVGINTCFRSNDNSSARKTQNRTTTSKPVRPSGRRAIK